MERRYGGSCAIRLGPPIPNPATNGPGRENQHAETGMHQMTQESHELKVTTAHGG